MDPHTRFWAAAGMIAFALFVIWGLASGVRAGYKRRDAVKEWAFRCGMNFTEGPVDASSVAQLPNTPGSEEYTRRRASNVLTGRRGTYDVALFDLMDERKDRARVNRHVFTYRTVAVLKLPGRNLPYFQFSAFNVQPGTFAASMVDKAMSLAKAVDHGEHGVAIEIPNHPGFILVGREPDRVRELFTQDVIDYFAHHGGFSIAGEGSTLLIEPNMRKSVVDMEDLDYFLSQTTTIASQFDREASRP